MSCYFRATVLVPTRAVFLVNIIEQSLISTWTSRWRSCLAVSWIRTRRHAFQRIWTSITLTNVLKTQHEGEEVRQQIYSKNTLNNVGVIKPTTILVGRHKEKYDETQLVRRQTVFWKAVFVVWKRNELDRWTKLVRGRLHDKLNSVSPLAFPRMRGLDYKMCWNLQAFFVSSSVEQSINENLKLV